MTKKNLSKTSMTRQRVEDLRIFVIVPETVQVDLEGHLETISMPSGRLMAQAAHVVSRMRVTFASTFKGVPITTIVYGVRNSRELAKLQRELWAIESDKPLLRTVAFYDKDYTFYGTGFDVLTAVCTTPVLREQVDDILGHLELAK